MARINIEDELYKDIRFIELVVKKGSMDSALGNIVRAFSLAQKHYLSIENHRLIPLKEWEKSKIGNDIIDVGLAKKTLNGIYVSGSNSQFNWLLQRSNAGKKGRKTKKKIQDKELTTVNDRSTTVNDRQRVETSYSLYNSNSNSSSYSDSNSLCNSYKDVDNQVISKNNNPYDVDNLCLEENKIPVGRKKEKKRENKNTKLKESGNREAITGIDPKKNSSLLIFEIWNGQTSFPSIRVISSSRKAKAKAQWKKYPDEKHWYEALEKFVQSDFVNNQWNFTFDSFLQEDKRIKALEGAYENKTEYHLTHQQKVSNNNQILMNKILKEKEEEEPGENIVDVN